MDAKGRWIRLRGLLEEHLSEPLTDPGQDLAPDSHRSRQDSHASTQDSPPPTPDPGDGARLDPDLGQELRRLVEAARGAGAFLESGVGAAAPELLADLEERGPDGGPGPGPGEARPGDPVGPYRLLRLVGEGGMGTVFLAERADGAFRRRVALKVLRSGLDLAPILDRFRTERQILASLTHPSIARLLDGGTTAEGRLWFAMEFVPGEPIDAFCDARRLPVDGRIRLFLTVARAVAHAHRNLVVHGDLKPGNILVTPPASRSAEPGEVHLVDFGIARALEPLEGRGRGGPEGLGGHPPRSPFLTPAFASPEQRRGEPVGTGSDVYQLGVLLRGLLTGVWPSRREATGARPDPREIAWMRATTPGRLGRRIGGDLESIMGKALRFHAEERYPSVEALVEDLERHRSRRPVEARGHLPLYRTGRFLRRNALPVATLSLVLLLLGGYAVTLTLHTARLSEALEAADREAERAEQVTASLLGLIQASHPERTSDSRLAGATVLEEAAAQARLLADHPLLKARLLEAVAGVHGGRGESGMAVPLLEVGVALRRGAQGERHPQVADALEALGRALAPDPPQAGPIFQEALAIRREALGPHHPATTRAMDLVASVRRREGRIDEAEGLWREALALRRAAEPQDPAGLAKGMFHLGDLLRVHRGEMEEAEALYREGLALQESHLGQLRPERLHGLHSLADLLGALGDREAEEALLREAVAVSDVVFGEGSLGGTESLRRTVEARARQGRFEEAFALTEQVLRIREATLGSEHPSVASALVSLAAISTSAGRLEEAEAAQRRALASRARLFGPTAPIVAVGRAELGEILRLQGKEGAAREEFQAALRILADHHPDAHPEVAAVLGRMGRMGRM